jgi:hypothetical protein
MKRIVCTLTVLILLLFAASCGILGDRNRIVVRENVVENIVDLKQNVNAEDTDVKLAPFPFVFSAHDIKNEIVTNDDLGEKEIFFIYLWSTT